ncbi:MAG: hypothetical protein HDT48_06880 [Ruminococcaceae bacterium]|nr:hypothetical protein [Oscillospiraceae bacterium]
MKNELTAYIRQVEEWIGQSGGLDGKRLESIRINIGFFQHERLIHLIVTMTFALLTVISLGLTVSEIYFLPLFVLFLVLEVPYVFHYYKLENGVQKLQRLYRTAEEKVKGDQSND